ncbi:MAG: hypothetical protein NPIRA02_25980 [Nitrospirales bacterium]|nr:MAG: hypothetical protein NPIRA02_25980 [Nitrospirales bacterium]
MELVARYHVIGLMIVLLTIWPSTFITSTYGQTDKGKVLFEEHCAECHGRKGDGRGAVGSYLEGQQPANLLAHTTQTRSDQELFKIIRYGIHLEMASWENILEDQEIRTIVTYLRDLALYPTATHE